jgi:hypothetical protein
VPYRRQASWKFRGGNMSSVNFYGNRLLRHTAAVAPNGEPEALLDTVRALGGVPKRRGCVEEENRIRDSEYALCVRAL